MNWTEKTIDSNLWSFKILQLTTANLVRNLLYSGIEKKLYRINIKKNSFDIKSKKIEI